MGSGYVEDILKRATVYRKKIKNRVYLYVKLGCSRDPSEFAPLIAELKRLGFTPQVMRIGEHYYYLLLHRLGDVKRVIENYIGVENLPPTCREIYEEKYAKEEVWGLKYNLTSVLRSEGKRPILYYVLGALFGDGYIISKHKICLAVKDLELVEKFEDRVSAIGLHSFRETVKQDGGEHYYRVIVASTHLILLYKSLGRRVERLAEIDEKSFWKFVEGLYETDGSLRLKRSRSRKKYFEVRIKLSKDPGPQLLKVVGDRLKKLGLVVKVKPRDKGRSHVLRIKEKQSIVKFFTHIDPVIKNPKTGKLSIKIRKACKRRGVDPEELSKEWVKRWKEYIEELSEEGLDP